MKTSDKINVTDARLRKALKSEFDFSVMPGINNKIFKVASDSKMQIGVMTKFYPYLDKSEVKLRNNSLILCRNLHHFSGNLIDFFTPEGEYDYCSELKEPCIIPREEIECLILDVNDSTNEYILVGFLGMEELIGMNPAKPGNLKLVSKADDNEYWIKFGGDNLNIRVPEGLVMNQGRLDEEMQTIDYVTPDDTYSKTEIDIKLDEIINDESAFEENEIDLNMETLSNGYLCIEANLIKKEED